MINTFDINCTNLMKDCALQYIVGDFYSQLSDNVRNVVLVEDKAIILTENGQTIIESGLDFSGNIIDRMQEYLHMQPPIDCNFTDYVAALQVTIGQWEITALISESTVYITKT